MVRVLSQTWNTKKTSTDSETVSRVVVFKIGRLDKKKCTNCLRLV